MKADKAKVIINGLVSLSSSSPSAQMLSFTVVPSKSLLILCNNLYALIGKFARQLATNLSNNSNPQL